MSEPKIKRYKLVKHIWPDEKAKIKRKRIRTFTVVVSIIVAVFVGFIGGASFNGTNINKDEFDKFKKAYSVMEDEFYFGDGDEEYRKKLMDAAIEGMINAGEDIHTTYLNEKNSEDFQSKLAGSFVGIGVQYYELDKGQFILKRVFRDSPAEKAGLIAGDEIVSVEGESVEKDNSETLAGKITGEANTKVKMEVKRNGEIIPKEIERQEVSDSVFSEIENGNGILEITNFSSKSGDETLRQLEQLKADGCRRLIIDLRDNTGGYLEAVEKIAGYLLPEDTTILQQKDKNKEYSEYKTKNNKQITFEKIVVLVNGDTASASEVLTAALKENLNVAVVGVKTYGKGTVQIPYTFEDGSMIKYTIAEWLTPSGKSIDKVGITPDTIVEIDPLLTMQLPELKDDTTIEANTVDVSAMYVQSALRFLGYEVDREDFYFTQKSSDELKKFQQNAGLEVTGKINNDGINALVAASTRKWREEQVNLDLQMQKAKVIVNE